MGMIGDLLYPDNADMAAELNRDQDTLQRTNALHNDLVNAYRALADEIRTFDAYLMALLVMQYHLVYAREDLENLPDTRMPTITSSIADTIESLALDAVTVKMAYGGLKAIGSRIANVVQEGGSYRAAAGQNPAALEGEMQSQLDVVSTQSNLVRAGNVDMLTQTGTDAADLQKIAGELGEGAGDLGEVAESGELAEGGELAETVESVATGTEAAAEAGEAAIEAGEAAAEVGADAAAVGGAAILGPAVIIVVVVTEIIATINAAETHAKLKKALADMHDMQKQSDKSMATLRKALKSLLTSAKVDIGTYNSVLDRLFKLEGNSYYKVSFGTTGLESAIAAIDGVTIDRTGALPGLQAACSADVKPATDFIRRHCVHDATMTDVIAQIKTHLRRTGQPDVDDEFLFNLADVENLDPAVVRKYNAFRQAVAELASVLKPYHEQVRQESAARSGRAAAPSSPTFGRPDPRFDPRPEDFAVPAPPAAAAAV